MKAAFHNHSSETDLMHDRTVGATDRLMPGSSISSINTDKPDAIRPRPNLTEREKEVLRLVCDGLTNFEIAACLGVSRETVKSELKRIFRKVGVANRTQAAVLLVKQGWL